MLFKKKDTLQVPSSLKDGQGEREPEPEPALEPLATVDTTATEDIVYPSGLRFVLLLSATFASMFLVALVRPYLSLFIFPPANSALGGNSPC